MNVYQIPTHYKYNVNCQMIDILTVSRDQVPVIPNFAMTDFASQEEQEQTMLRSS